MRSRINRLNGGGRTYIRDDFDGAAGSSVTENSNASGFVWDWANPGVNLAMVLDASGRVTYPDTPSAVGQPLQASSRLRRKNGEVQIDVIRAGAAQTSPAAATVHVCARMATRHQPREFIHARYALSSTLTNWTVVKNNTTQVGSGALTQALTQDHRYRLRFVFRGSVVLQIVDDVILQRIDSSILSAGRGYGVGIRFDGGVGVVNTPMRLDNFAALR